MGHVNPQILVRIVRQKGNVLKNHAMVTFIDENGFPSYKRRDNDRYVEKNGSNGIISMLYHITRNLFMSGASKLGK